VQYSCSNGVAPPTHQWPIRSIAKPPQAPLIQPRIYRHGIPRTGEIVQKTYQIPAEISNP
jgi:hypothetical protein